jgi:hypothetical protein
MDLFLYGVLLVAIVLWNLLMRVLARRRRQQQDSPPPVDSPGAAPVPQPWGRAGEPEPWGRQPGAPDGAATAARSEPVWASPPAQRRPGSTRFRSRQEVRQAIIAMTVLGPCRAMDPYDASGGAAGAPRPGPGGERRPG